MANREQIDMLLQHGVNEWEKWRIENPNIMPDFSEADLSGADLREANLCGANLFKADLSKADLSEATLIEANLMGADLSEADLSGADLSKAYLSEANLCGANLDGADLSGANLSGADLSEADLSDAYLSDADLREANLMWAIINDTNLSNADLNSTTIGWTKFVNVDLSTVRRLNTVIHRGPSTIGVDTISNWKGDIPEDFLRGCGMSQWEIEVAHLYNMALTPEAISEILDVRIFRARTEGAIYIGGIFISYSRADSKFVDKLYKELKESGGSVWLDRHDLLAGSLKEQLTRAIRIQDIAIVVLSENSIDSDWVENELEMARKKEKDEGRDVICPIALDDSWETKVEGDVLWRQLKLKVVLDFSSWQTEEFDRQFNRLLDGIKINYEKRITVPKKSDNSVKST